MNQEPKLRTEISRKPHQQTYNELYFPELRSSIFAILSGQKDIFAELKIPVNDELNKLSNGYQVVLSEAQEPISIKFDFTETGISLSGIRKFEKEEEPKPDLLYLKLTWDDDVVLLTLIARALHTLILICTRTIPNLSSDMQRFKLVSTIETNPLYEYYAVIFAMYIKLNMKNVLPKSHVQVLMSRKRVTYNSLVQALRYVITLPPVITDFFNGDIVKQHTYRLNRGTDKDGNQVVEDISYIALFLVDFTGQKFTQKLSFQVGPKQQFTSTRFIEMDSDIV